MALSPDGQVALVGAPVDSGAAFRAGAAYRFEHTSEGWMQTAKILASDAQGGDGFGEAVALDHDIAMIGTADSEPMQAYVFEGFSGVDCNANGQPDACDIFLGLSLDLNADGIPDECQQPCPADINDSGGVDVSDLLMVINAWGPCPLPCPADVVLNGQVDVSDLLAVINAWGACR